MDKSIKKILIVGAGVAGRELTRELGKISRGYNLVGFVDDDVAKKGKEIGGFPVLGGIEHLGSLIKRFDIDEIFIAIPSADGGTIRRILDSAQGLRVKFKIVPRTLEIVRGKFKLYQLRDVQVADFLGRAIIKSEQEVFLQEFKGKKILVTGAAGSIGSELCRQLVQFSPKSLIAFDWSENGLFSLNMELGGQGIGTFEYILGSVQDVSRLRDVIFRLKPYFIFHAAAFKHISITESNPLEAIKNNIFGTMNVANTALEAGVEKFIYISSDKAADPVSIMGATKLIGEYIISALNGRGKTKFSAVRFGNVLESSGSVIPIFRKQIADGGPVTVTDPRMTRYMMTIPEAVQLVLNATKLAKGGEVFMLYMGEKIKIDQIARFMIQLAGFVPDKDIEIKYVGSRLGEKLEEQLTGRNEQVEATVNEMIFNVKRETSNIRQRDLLKLLRAVETNNVAWALSYLKKVCQA